ALKSMKIADRILGWLLVLGALLHAGGSIVAARNNPQLLVWALSGSLAALLVAAMNLLRVNRPQDRALAALCFFGSLGWAAGAIGFGGSIGNVFDPRAMYHAIDALALAVMSVRTYIHAHGSISA